MLEIYVILTLIAEFHFCIWMSWCLGTQEGGKLSVVSPDDCEKEKHFGPEQSRPNLVICLTY